MADNQRQMIRLEQYRQSCFAAIVTSFSSSSCALTQRLESEKLVVISLSQVVSSGRVPYSLGPTTPNKEGNGSHVHFS